jgi:gamma-glutamylcyclotransferase (GGCT)/AIG2-like uncharacterized protein YtfP
MKAEAKQLVPKYYPIFSYGSNDSVQLFDRCGGIVVGPVAAHLRNHTRIFVGYSNRWEGGVASVRPSKGDYVQGSVFYLNTKQLEVLDSWEGGYHRVVKQVTLEDGSKIMAFVYINDESNNKTNFTYLPSVVYMKAIHRMLQETKHTPRISIPKSIEPYAVNPVFSYGCNTINQLRENYGRIINDALAAYLPQHMLVFGGHSHFWKGAIASVVPTKGTRCYGAMVLLTDKQIVALDAKEAGDGRYIRDVFQVVVKSKHGEHTIPCYCHIKNDVDFQSWPSILYMKAIRTLLEDVGLKKESKNILITTMKNNKKYKVAHFKKNRIEQGI